MLQRLFENKDGHRITANFQEECKDESAQFQVWEIISRIPIKQADT